MRARATSQKTQRRWPRNKLSIDTSYLDLPANATDALVRASITVREPRDGYTIVAAPERPDYWFANCLVLAREPTLESYAAWTAKHAAIFAGRPVKRHVIVWEVTHRSGPPPYDGSIERERTTVFRVNELSHRHAARIVQIREFDDASHWESAIGIERDALIADGLDDRVAFAAWRFGVYRADALRGMCRVWGAFIADRLVSYVGLYANDRYARFITPLTEPAFRRQGLFAALCTIAVAETRSVHPHASIVIVAVTGDDPERIYQRLGFEAIGEQHALIAPISAAST